MKKRSTLTKKTLNSFLKNHDQWILNKPETSLTRKISFNSHIAALVFIARVTVHAEVLAHHPDIEFSYRTVKISLTTHDLKCLTTVDIALAERIDNLSLT